MRAGVVLFVAAVGAAAYGLHKNKQKKAAASKRTVDVVDTDDPEGWHTVEIDFGDPGVADEWDRLTSDMRQLILEAWDSAPLTLLMVANLARAQGFPLVADWVEAQAQSVITQGLPPDISDQVIDALKGTDPSLMRVTAEALDAAGYHDAADTLRARAGELEQLLGLPANNWGIS